MPDEDEPTRPQKKKLPVDCTIHQGEEEYREDCTMGNSAKIGYCEQAIMTQTTFEAAGVLMVGRKQTKGANRSNSPQAALLRVLGFALLRGWPFVFSAVSASAVWPLGDNVPLLDIDWFYGVNVLSLSVTLLLLATFSRKSSIVIESRTAPALASAGLAISSLLVWCGVAMAFPALALCGRLTAGLSCALLNLFWANLYVRLSYRTIVTEVPLAICMGSLFAIIGSAVPPAVLMALSVLIPVVMVVTIIVLQVRYSAKAFYEPVSFSFEKLGASMAFCLLAIAFIGGTARGIRLPSRAVPSSVRCRCLWAISSERRWC